MFGNFNVNLRKMIRAVKLNPRQQQPPTILEQCMMYIIVLNINVSCANLMHVQISCR